MAVPMRSAQRVSIFPPTAMRVALVPQHWRPCRQPTPAITRTQAIRNCAKAWRPFMACQPGASLWQPAPVNLFFASQPGCSARVPAASGFRPRPMGTMPMRPVPGVCSAHQYRPRLTWYGLANPPARWGRRMALGRNGCRSPNLLYLPKSRARRWCWILPMRPCA